METILNYLDNMFVNMPKTPEVLRAKEDLAEMMEDKYNELIAEGKMQNEAIGIVISEFGNIQELIEELEITEEKKSLNNDFKTNFSEADFIKDEKSKNTNDTSKIRHVSDLEADEYLFAVKQSAGKIGAGTFLCICSPILLMILDGMKSFVPSISDSIVAGVGLTVLFSMVACAVGLFISSGMKMDTYDYLKKECFILNSEYEQTIYHIWETHKKKFSFKITAGVILCILSVIPVIICSSVIAESNKNEFPIIICVAILMVMVAIGVFLFITAGMEEESYKVILQEKEFSANKKSEKKLEEIISAIYWPIIIIIYLVWSIVSGNWGITWIIWPFAGIIISIICKIIESDGLAK